MTVRLHERLFGRTIGSILVDRYEKHLARVVLYGLCMFDEIEITEERPVQKIKGLYREPSAIRRSLAQLADLLISTALGGGQIIEGVVTTMSRRPYRRLDCDGRAIAYIRVRPRRAHIRVDITGLWIAPRYSRLRVPGAGGTIVLVGTTEADIIEIATFLEETVRRTREAFLAAKSRR